MSEPRIWKQSLPAIGRWRSPSSSPEPPRALGSRGAARSYLGERAGVEDMRRALKLALDQGQGRVAGILHNNLTVVSWGYEGTRAAREAAREGIEFSERRGIAEIVLAISAMAAGCLAELGLTDQALAEVEPVADRLRVANDINFIEARSLQLRLLAERGDLAHDPALDKLVAAARQSDEPQPIAIAFAAATLVLLAQGQPDQVQPLLDELDQTPAIRTEIYYASLLPELLRTALALGDAALAARLADGVELRTPLAEHALIACRAQLAEAAGDHAHAAALYSEAAERWREFGNAPERAYALLGQGRCLRALGSSEAEQQLREARELFASMGYKPALAKADGLLGSAKAAAS